MTRKIFGFLLCMVIVNGVFAQSYLLTNRIVNQRIQTGYFMQKVGSTVIDNDTCINAVQSKNALYLNETVVPTDGRMPPDSNLLPLLTIPCTSTSWALCATQSADYTSCGSYIYSQGFNNTLTTFTRTKIDASNTFWIGATANCGIIPATSSSSTTLSTASVAGATTAFSGPLNRCGMWATCGSVTGPVNQWVGIKRTITANATQTIYIGVGARSAFRIIIDALTVVTYGSAGNVQPYKLWHIFPITMGPGIHTLTIQAENLNETGVLGVEFYNNTSAEITAATGYEGLKLLFSTKDMVGKYICL